MRTSVLAGFAFSSYLTAGDPNDFWSLDREAVDLALKNAAFMLSERALRATLHGSRAVDPGDVALQEALRRRDAAGLDARDVSEWMDEIQIALGRIHEAVAHTWFRIEDAE